MPMQAIRTTRFPPLSQAISIIITIIIIVVTDIHYHVCMNTHAYMYILLHTKSSYVAEGRNSLEHYTYTLHLDTDKTTVYVGACTCVHVRNVGDDDDDDN